jgi:hypothetical protein
MEGAVWGFIGVIVGSVVTGGWNLIAERMRTNREQRLDRYRRRDNRRIDRDRFQQKTLFDLQAAIQQITVIEVQIVSGQYRGAALLDAVNRNGALAWQIMALGSLVADADLSATTVKVAQAASGIRGKDAASDQASDEVARLAGEVLRRSGQLVERLFEAPPEEPEPPRSR